MASCRWELGGGVLLKLSEQGTGNSGSGRCLCGLGFPGWDIGGGVGRTWWVPVEGLGVRTLPGLMGRAHLDHLGMALPGCPGWRDWLKSMGRYRRLCSAFPALATHFMVSLHRAVSFPRATVK